MTRHVRSIVLIALPLAALLGISAGSALAGTLPGCANPSDPALNEYCDSVPSAGGPQTPYSGGTAGGGNIVSPASSPSAAVGTGAAAGATGTGGSAAGTSAGGTPVVGVTGATVTIRAAGRGNHRTASGPVPEALTTLPAPTGTHLALKPSAANVGGFGPLTTWIIVIAAALGLALASSALIRKRQRRTGTG